MGDRANVCIKGSDGPAIFLYTHWSGEELPNIVAKGLSRGQGRWQDPPYLRRIIFSEMIKDSVLSETGFGISGSICDNQYPILLVDLNNQTVGLSSEDEPEKPFITTSIAAFVENPSLIYAEVRPIQWRSKP